MGVFGSFSLLYHFSLFPPPLWETARFRLKYCLKGPLSPKQPTYQHYCSRPRSQAGSKVRLRGLSGASVTHCNIPFFPMDLFQCDIGWAKKKKKKKKKKRSNISKLRPKMILVNTFKLQICDKQRFG